MALRVENVKLRGAPCVLTSRKLVRLCKLQSLMVKFVLVMIFSVYICVLTKVISLCIMTLITRRTFENVSFA